MLRFTAETINAEEQTQTPQVFAMLQHLPQHTVVVKTALLTVGALSDWMASTADSGEKGCKQQCLEMSIQFCMMGLASPEFASHAAEAFKDLGETCAEMLGPYVDVILAGCKSILLLQLA